MQTDYESAVIKQALRRRMLSSSIASAGANEAVAVMAHAAQPARVLLSVRDGQLREQLRRRLNPMDLQIESASEDAEAFMKCAGQFYPIIVTESPDLIRCVRSLPQERYSVALLVVGPNQITERLEGLDAGADDCICADMAESELRARIGAARRINDLESLLRSMVAQNRKLTTTDEPTGLHTARYFEKHFPREAARAMRYWRSLSLILCEIDSLNSLGNEKRDKMIAAGVLKQFGARLKGSLRRGIDWAARLDEGKCAIVLPETGYQQALQVARRLRTNIGRSPFTIAERSVPVTASFGLCGLDKASPGERRMAERLIQVAETALERSRSGGGNRVTAVLLPQRRPQDHEEEKP